MYGRALLTLFTSSILLLTGCGSEGARGVPDSGPTPVDQCLNPTDVAITRPDAGMSDGGAVSTPSDAVRACGIGPCLDIALADGDVTECVAACLEGTIYGGLSPGCLGCYIDTFDCGREHCVVECLGADEVACYACLDTNCFGAFYICSGLPPL